MDRSLADQFVGMYVNDWTLDYGAARPGGGAAAARRGPQGRGDPEAGGGGVRGVNADEISQGKYRRREDHSRQVTFGSSRPPDNFAEKALYLSFNNHALIMSRTVLPLGIIGSTCSWYGTSRRARTAPCCRASRSSASSTSSLAVTRRLPQRKPLAIVTKSGYGASPKPAPEVGVAAVALEEAVLPLHHHAQVLVVQHHHLDRHLLGVRSRPVPGCSSGSCRRRRYR